MATERVPSTTNLNLPFYMINRTDAKDVKNETIDENQIVDYILQKFNEKLNDKEHIFYVITERGELYELSEYEILHKENPNIPKAYIFIANLWFNDDPVRYRFPFIGNRDVLITIYFLKHYYESSFGNLKYIALINHFLNPKKTVMEVGDLDYIAKTLDVFNSRLKSKNEDGDGKEREIERYLYRHEIHFEFNFKKAEESVRKYYKERDESLAQYIKDLKELYYYMFHPRTIILDSNY